MAARTTKLFKNGNRWWLRLNSPSGERPRLSTGTAEDVRAQRIAVMVDELLEDRAQRHWIEALERDRVTLAELYDRRSRGQLEAFAKELETGVAQDLEPLVEKWIARLQKRAISEKQKRDYARQVRRLLPAGKAFPASDFNEDVLGDLLEELIDERTDEPLTGSTKKRYVAALRLFYRFARKQVPTLVSPFDDPDWLPKNNPSRMKYWDHATVLKVLAKMKGDARIAIMLVLATGIELTALLALKYSDVGANRTIIAHGTKNGARRTRTVFVDRWAWDDFLSWVKLAPSDTTQSDKLFDFQSDGGDLRDAFYQAQVDAGLIALPERSPSGKYLWSQVDVHTIHDGRHSYCYTRILGDDGEPRQSLKFCAHQLGHTTEQMVMQIYAKARMEDRIRELEQKEAVTAALTAASTSTDRAVEGATA